MSLHKLDFVFLVKANTPKKSLSTLMSALLTAGFNFQARPGSAHSTLLFVQLSAASYTELVQQDLVKCFEFGVTVKDDAPADRTQLVYHYLTGSKQVSGMGITPGRGEWAFVDAIMPVSGYLSDPALGARTQKSLASASLQTSTFRKVYGTGIAMYFEFLKHYVGYLVLLSVFGAVAYSKSKNYSMTYTFVNLVGSVVFILTWKRRERYLASVWGVQNSHKLEQHDAEVSSLNKDFELKSTYKHGKRHDGARFMKQWAFVPVALVFVTVLFAVQMLCFTVEIFTAEIYDGPLQSLLKLIPTVALAVFVPVLTIVYKMTVNKYVAWECHDNKYSQYDSFLAKTFILNFLTGYVPLLVTSFVYLPFAHLIQDYLPEIKATLTTKIPESKFMLHYLAKVKRQEDFIINQDRLNSQFFFFMVTNQVIALVLKYALPLILPRVINFVKTKVLKKEPDAPIYYSPEEDKWLDTVRKSIALPEFNLHDDFGSLALQFGYLAMFGPVWTLAPAVCLIFNVIIFKLDTWKLASGKYYRPPVPSRRDLIHPWDQAFLILAWLGSVISPVVTSFYRNGTKPPKTLGQFAFDKASINVSSSVLLMLTLFFSEHLFFGLYIIGSKASRLILTKEEELTNFLDNDLRVRKDYYSNLVQLKADVSDSSEWKSQTEQEAMQTAQAASLTGISSKGEEQANLRARKGKGDKIINVKDADGHTTEAIIDDNQHIPMEDVKELEAKLAQNAKKSKKA